jgi:predicted dinucleotide-binding enzyme
MPDSSSSGVRRTVAILGNGEVGIALAKGFASLGHAIVFGTRQVDGDKTRQALGQVAGSRAASFADAARSADIAVTALPWSGLADALRAAGPDHFAGKLVIDPSNPLDFSSGAPALAVGHDDSAGETVQRLLPQARVVKAFNIITAAHMVKPALPDGVPDMFIAGNDDGAKAEVARVLHDFGWRKPIDIGDIAGSRLLEALAMLWIVYGLRNNYWIHGFSLLGRKPEEATDPLR